MTLRMKAGVLAIALVLGACSTDSNPSALVPSDAATSNREATSARVDESDGSDRVELLFQNDAPVVTTSDAALAIAVGFADDGAIPASAIVEVANALLGESSFTPAEVPEASEIDFALPANQIDLADIAVLLAARQLEPEARSLETLREYANRLLGEPGIPVGGVVRSPGVGVLPAPTPSPSTVPIPTPSIIPDPLPSGLPSLPPIVGLGSAELNFSNVVGVNIDTSPIATATVLASRSPEIGEVRELTVSISTDSLSAAILLTQQGDRLQPGTYTVISTGADRPEQSASIALGEGNDSVSESRFYNAASGTVTLERLDEQDTRLSINNLVMQPTPLTGSTGSFVLNGSVSTPLLPSDGGGL